MSPISARLNLFGSATGFGVTVTVTVGVGFGFVAAAAELPAMAMPRMAIALIATETFLKEGLMFIGLIFCWNGYALVNSLIQNGKH
jgi:hypothetical protein